MAEPTYEIVAVSVGIPGDLLDELDRRAEKDSRSRSNMLAVLLREALDAQSA